MKKLLLTISSILSIAHAANSFDGFYAGPAVSTATDHHTLDNGQGLYKKATNDHKKVDVVLGYGIILSPETPLYIGLEAYIPLKNEQTSQDVDMVIGGVKRTDAHILKKIFPAEGAFKIGFLIDEKVMIFAKIGCTHQRMRHTAPTLNHNESWNTTTPLYGFGLTFKVNGHWLLHGEFIAHNASTQKALIFSHDYKHQRIQVSVSYRF